MSTYVEEPTAIRGRFNFVSYGKAGTVLSMFLNALTPETFHKGLKYYLTDMYYKAGEPEDLFRGLQQAYDEDTIAGTLRIASVMSTWVYQAGYPLISVERSGTTFVFKQERYPSGNGELYSIPITFATTQNPNFNKKTPNLWLRDESMDMSEFSVGAWGNDWIVLNVQQSGFYRVSYSANLWMAIRDGLKVNPDVIHLTNRRVLQEELNIGIAISNRLLASTVLEFLTYLSEEENYLVWNDANVNFALFNRTLFGTEMYANYMNFIAQLTRSHLTRIGYEASSSDEAIEITQLRLRVKTLNCYALDEVCLQHELDKLIKYYENETENAIPEFCSAFRLANQTLFDHYVNELTTNVSLAQRNVIARTIHCTLNKDFAELLTVIVEDKLNILTSTERTNIVQNLLTNEAGFDAAMAYLDRNLAEINLFTSQLAVAVNSIENSNKLNELIEKALIEEVLTNEAAQIIKTTVENNLLWHQKHSETLREFFIASETTTVVVPTTTDALTTTSSSTTTTTTTDAPTPLSASGLIISTTLIIALALISSL